MKRLDRQLIIPGDLARKSDNNVKNKNVISIWRDRLT